MTGPRVLFANHTSELAGAERLLVDALDTLREVVVPTVACPKGELFEELSARGLDVAEIPDTSVSFRPHPLHTSRGLAQLARAGNRLRRLSRKIDAQLIDAHTERAGLAAVLARRLGAPPVVAHAHARFPDGLLGSATARALAWGSSAVIANSAHTATQFDGVARDHAVAVVHNPIDCDHYDPASSDRDQARAALGLEPSDEVLAVVGYLAPVKCQDDAVRILAAVRQDHPRARLVLAGSTRFTAASARDDSEAYVRKLKHLVSELGLDREVLFTGEVDDVREVLAAADVLLVPSRQEGFGRVALEGLAMAIPVAATSVGGTPEIVRDGIDGLILDPGDPARWAEAVTTLLSDSARRAEMGASGRQRAMCEFGPNAYRDGVMGVYERVLAASSTGT